MGKDKASARKAERGGVRVRHRRMRLRFLPCRISGFMRITVPSVVHELSEKNIFFGVRCNFFKS